MSKLLLICDEYIYRYEGSFYAGSQERLDFFNRYIRVFDKVRLALRCIDEPTLKAQRVLINNPRFEIVPLTIFHGPKEYLFKYWKVGNELKDVSRGCDAAILRLPSTVAQRAYKDVKNAGIPYATEIVFDANDGAETEISLIKKLLWRKIDKEMRNICYQADGVSCVTEHYLQKRYFSKKENHFVSHYSSLTLKKDFFTSPRHYPEKSTLTIAHIDMQIGLHSRKGTAEIIQALRILKERGVMVNVKFAGDDWDNSTVDIYNYASQNDVRGQVECIGYLTREKLDIFLDESDLFVMPTKAEGLPRVIIEAIAKGLPVITSPVSGNPELVPADFLVEYSDINGLANKILEVVKSPKVYEEASKTNYEHSLLYESSILEKRRDEFYLNLKNKCKYRD